MHPGELTVSAQHWFVWGVVNSHSQGSASQRAAGELEVAVQHQFGVAPEEPILY